MAKTATKSANAPVFTFRRKGVSVSVFENQSGEGKTFFKAAVQRTYKEGDEWKTTTSLSRDDIGVAILGLQKAYEFVLDAEAKMNNHGE
jgi:hypothetical protein